MPSEELRKTRLFDGDVCDFQICGAACCVVPAMCSREVVVPMSRRCFYLGEDLRCDVFGTETRPRVCGTFFCDLPGAERMRWELQRFAIEFDEGKKS